MDFEKRMQQQLNDYESFVQNHPVETAIRLNPFKKFAHTHTDRVPWCENGFYLESRPRFAHDPLWHAGAYYVQEASSMFLEKAIQAVVNSPVLALDLCAAPGGKSTHLLSLLPQGSLLVSNEVIHSRISVLRENVLKWGRPDIVITNSDPSRFASLKEIFDVMVVDAPCSGEGLFRKDPSARKEWSPEQVQLCVNRQRRILKDSWPALKTGGYLIYSTCTFAPEEDEENIAWFCEKSGAQCIPLPCDWSIEEVKIKSAIGYRFYPHRLRGEGFFMAVLKKTADDGTHPHWPDPPHRHPVGDKSAEIPDDLKKRLSSWIIPNDYHVLINHSRDARRSTAGKNSNGGNVMEIKLFNNHWLNEFQAIQNCVSVADFGINVCSVKKDKLIPEHSFALCTDLNVENFHHLAVDEIQALKYLRKESLVVDAPPGYVFITCQNIPLGWINNLGNRSNNLYPTEWRLRK